MYNSIFHIFLHVNP